MGEGRTFMIAVGNIKNYLKIVLVILVLAVLLFAGSAFISTEHNQQTEKNSVNNSTINNTSPEAASNGTEKSSVNPISISLEKPPFID